MIRLNCFFKANSGQYAEALDAACKLTAKSLEHEGNIAYDVFESATREDIFMICETWEDSQSLAKHAATPEFKKYVEIIQACGSLKIEQLDM